MKKIIATILCFAMACFAFGCNNSSESSNTEKKEYTFVMPDGAPVLAAVNLIKNYPEIDGHKMNYKVVAASSIAQEYTKNADLAVMPTNAAATLYSKGVDIKLASVNVFGVLYMLGQTELASLADLKGKVIYSIGEGNTPDLLMKYYLSQAGVESVKSDEPIEGKAAFVYVNEAPAAIQAMKMYQTGKSTKKVDYLVIGQPAATNALKNLENTKIVFDFQAEWKTENGSNYPQAGIVVKGAVAEDQAFIKALRVALAENYRFITENPTAVTDVLTANNSSLKSITFTKELIDACNIGYTSSAAIKSSLEAYFTKATAHDATASKFYGGTLPGADFYLN